MKLDDDELARLYREGTRAADRDGCPDAEQLHRAARDDLAPTARASLIEHLVACSDCAEEYRLVAQVQPKLPGRSVARASRWIGIAASLLIVAVASLVWWMGDEAPSGRRGQAGIGSSVTPANGSVVETTPERLSWTGRPDTTYRVEVYDAESVPLWSSPRIVESSIELPAELRDKFEPGSVYYWRVYSERQVEKSRSDLYRFTLAP